MDITISPATLGHFESPKQPNGVGTQRVIGTFRVFNLLESGCYSPAGALRLPHMALRASERALRAHKLTAAPPSVISKKYQKLSFFYSKKAPIPAKN